MKNKLLFYILKFFKAVFPKMAYIFFLFFNIYFVIVFEQHLHTNGWEPEITIL